MRLPTFSRAIGCVCGLLFISIACHAPAVEVPKTGSPAIERDPAFTLDVRQAVAYLASDELEGRGIGTAGIDKAADYIASTFKSLGLATAPGAKNYFQPFTITAATAADPATSLTAGEQTFALEKDFGVVSLSAEDKFDAPVVFVGYGISSKEYDYDDYAGMDVKGKVVLALRYEPQDADGVSRFTRKKDDWSGEAPLINKAKNAAKLGAVALLLVNPPLHHEDAVMPFIRQSLDDRASIPYLHLRKDTANALLAKSGSKSLSELQKQIDETGKPASQPLTNVSVAGQVKILRSDTEVKNVVGILPGKGELAGQFVVIGAHYDHLGKGGPGSLSPNSKEIHNGADDNASGTAAMLKLAEHYAKADSATNRRSLVFAAFTAEESGLIGSERFVNHPLIPIDKIAYMLNLDMVGRLKDNSLSVGGTGTAASFEKMLKDADDASPLEFKTFGKGGFGPSDHTSFAMKQIPVLFFWTGTHPDYHRPSDDADKINYDGIEQVIAISTKVIDTFATHTREQYVSTFDHSGMSPGGRGGSRVSLGVVPDYGSGDEKGVKISGTTPGSPAEKAGLKAGDILIQFNDEKLETLYTLTDVLAKAKPGDKVKLVVVRDGKNVEVEATLAERKG